MEGMTHEEAPYKFQWMNLDIEFYRGENGEWWVRVMDADTAGSGTTGLWVEQPLAMAMEPLTLMTTLGGMLVSNQAIYGTQRYAKQTQDPR